jgi:hypothetical protein
MCSPQPLLLLRAREVYSEQQFKEHPFSEKTIPGTSFFGTMSISQETRKTPPARLGCRFTDIILASYQRKSTYHTVVLCVRRCGLEVLSVRRWR